MLRGDRRSVQSCRRRAPPLPAHFEPVTSAIWLVQRAGCAPALQAGCDVVGQDGWLRAAGAAVQGDRRSLWRALRPGGLPGDAYVSIRTRADPRFTRADADLRHDMHIQAPDAARSATVAVPVPGGRPGSGCHREPSPAACSASQARACRAMAGTAAAAWTSP